MIDVCRFLDSKDIAKYLREIGYEFSAPEAAFIVYCSNDATLDEKSAAWLDITDMDVNGFFMSKKGDLYRDSACCNYLDLEYWEGDLGDADRWATVVSAHLKGEIDFVECFNLLRFLRIDQESHELRKFYDGFYSEKYYPDSVWNKIRHR